MATARKKTDQARRTVWYRNTKTGRVDGFARGSMAHKNVAKQTFEDADGIPHPLWVEEDKPPTSTQAAKFRSGVGPTWVAPKGGEDVDEESEDDSEDEAQ